ncbi:hypothetical protein TELCIR_15859, partial [Teladorsagia circumcincta]
QRDYETKKQRKICVGDLALIMLTPRRHELLSVYMLGAGTLFLYLGYTMQAFIVYNNGEGAYLSEHSSRQTLESNTGIETAVGHS